MAIIIGRTTFGVCLHFGGFNGNESRPGKSMVGSSLVPISTTAIYLFMCLFVEDLTDVVESTPTGVCVIYIYRSQRVILPRGKTNHKNSGNWCSRNLTTNESNRLAMKGEWVFKESYFPILTSCWASFTNSSALSLRAAAPFFCRRKLSQRFPILILSKCPCSILL